MTSRHYSSDAKEVNILIVVDCFKIGVKLVGVKHCDIIIIMEKKQKGVLSILLNSVINYNRPVRPVLRERLRTHKVFTKRTALYLNYPKLSYHVFTSLNDFFGKQTI